MPTLQFLMLQSMPFALFLLPFLNAVFVAIFEAASAYKVDSSLVK